MNYTTPRYDKDYSSFTSIEKREIRFIKRQIELAPYPPDTNDWKILHQFDNDYPQGIVGAHRINHFDRLTYELNLKTGEITFTNCRGHKYRGKTYADSSKQFRSVLSKIKSVCETREQRVAFNQLLNSFKFKDIDKS